MDVNSPKAADKSTDLSQRDRPRIYVANHDTVQQENHPTHKTLDKNDVCRQCHTYI